MILPHNVLPLPEYLVDIPVGFRFGGKSLDRLRDAILINSTNVFEESRFRSAHKTVMCRLLCVKRSECLDRLQMIIRLCTPNAHKRQFDGFDS